MGNVRFRCRDMVKTKFWDYNAVPGSTIYVDPGTHLTQQNQDVLYRPFQGPVPFLGIGKLGGRQ